MRNSTATPRARQEEGGGAPGPEQRLPCGCGEAPGGLVFLTGTAAVESSHWSRGTCEEKGAADNHDPPSPPPALLGARGGGGVRSEGVKSSLG